MWSGVPLPDLMSTIPGNSNVQDLQQPADLSQQENEGSSSAGTKKGRRTLAYNSGGPSPAQPSSFADPTGSAVGSARVCSTSRWNCEPQSVDRASTHSPFSPPSKFVVGTSPAILPSSNSGQKRGLPTGNVPTPSQNGQHPLRKKPRLHYTPHPTLDSSAIQGGFRQDTLPSPLFFSRSPRQKPPLPPRHCSSETGAAMLLRTVKLARGTMDTGGSPIRMVGTPDGINALDASSSSRSATPETGDKSSSIQVLNRVGVVELLEQDDRPTFVIDVGDPTTLLPGTLPVLFANPALRSCPGLLDLLIGKADQDSPGLAITTAFPEFKAWSTSFVKNRESLDVCLPSFHFAGISWTCSTLRKRLRFFSGTFNSVPVTTGFKVQSDRYLSPSTVGTEHYGRPPEFKDDLLKKMSLETTDYFGPPSVEIQSQKPSKGGREDGIVRLETSTSNHDNRLSKNATAEVVISSMQDSGSRSSETSSFSLLPNQVVSATDVAGRLEKPLDQVCFDWTRLPLSPALPRHIQFARSIDWASTSLGPIEHWSPTLRAMSNMVMASPHPAAMYWGDDHVAIYNEAYIHLAGQKHPTIMGCSYQEAWSEIWDAVKDVFANARLTGLSTMKDDDRLFMKRSGYLEETYFSWSIVPLVGEDGKVVGLYNPAFELTRRKIAERRMLTLREVGERTAAAREVKDFWGQVLAGLENNEYDTPFVLLYSVSKDYDGDLSSSQSKQCCLEGSLGVPEGHQAAPTQLDLRHDSQGFGPVFAEAMNLDHPVLLERENGSLSPELIDGISWRGFGDPCRAAVVCPIHPTTGDSILGFLVMGINPRRPYDDDYHLFVQLLSRQLATSLASVVLFEEEIRRGQRAARMAALDRMELSEQLAARTQEAAESETRFTRMAEFSPVGMFITDSNGRIIYINETWYKLSGHSKDVQQNSGDWMNSVKDEDQDLVHDLWRTILEKKIPMTAEFRFKTTWEDSNGSKGDTWVLASVYPEKDYDGTLKSIFGSVTNISQQKWAEDFQKRRMEEAIELKRQQENFIDITSHEMRNPLSAILQCADGISTSLTDFRARHRTDKPTLEILDSNIDAAQTIVLCAQHQKRIVDDILNLSKLDSALLLVTPVDMQPVKIAQRALKMFEGEVATADIKMEFHMDESVKELGIDWIRADPSRLLQVLINLTTNAIKFTTAQVKRTITVTLAASLERPSKNQNSCVSYFPTRSKRKDFTEGPDWGHGQEIFIHFAVQDTGRGLDENEKKLLFLRFSQASPRTHVQYGGSGLGLFISRELVELQGGEIGVSSERGKGSTFAFFLKARKSTAPVDAIEPAPMRRALTNEHVPTARPRIESATSRFTAGCSVKVLIVEDNLVNQRVLQQQLRNLGYTVYVSNHGEEALDRLKESTYWQGHEDDGLDLSVILMDLEMPVMDGLTCAREIRELQKSGKLVRHVPIIAVTANARIEQIDTALEAGMVSLNLSPKA